ncbi:hypothetical protein GGR56DRAFT_563140 [Xylariaceae sp. FL0804]|nr:hypothetical protein GGR56DRAFT_563140 [Xylariaceae sp. FL0804]
MDRAGMTPYTGPASEAEDPPKKRIRKSRSRGLRTKTGCLTCRKRHKKCDERAPVCGPCSVSSRDCVYADASCSSSIPHPKPPGAGLAVGKESDTASGISQDSSSHLAPSPHTSINPIPEGSTSQQPSPQFPLSDSYNYGFSPETVTSELLTADLASTRWLDLLATDAAQADGGFSLAPSPAPEGELSSDANYGGLDGAERPRDPRDIAHDNAVASERHAWQSDQDITLSCHEAVLFRTFTERAALWLDLFDPYKHFSTYAIRLALRNLGLMRAILALAARHNNILQAKLGPLGADPSEEIQYYYETLHYVQTALKFHSYAHSEELLATALVISTYEMLDAVGADSNWQRHLKGVFWIQRSQDVNGASGGLRQSVWWAWLRQDLWAAFRERRRCFSFWRPTRDYALLGQDELADRAIYLLSQSVNYCARDPDGGSSSNNNNNNNSNNAAAASNANAGQDPDPAPDPDAVARRAVAGEILMGMLERWKSFLGPQFRPLPTAARAARESGGCVFEPLWIHPPQFGSAIQVYHFARILITLHRPATAGFDGYIKTQRILSDAVAAICGIAMELKDEASQILSAQCLFGAGLCAQDDVKRETIISLIDACEARTGWPMASLRSDLRAEWAKVG